MKAYLKNPEKMLFKNGIVFNNQTMLNDLCIFKLFVMYQFHPLPAHDLIELKIITVILFEIFSIRLMHSTTKNITKQ